MLAHLGRSITRLGDLTIPGFYGSELRQHARQLLDGSDARGEWLALVRSEPGVGPLVPTTVIAPEPDAPAASATITVPEWPTTSPVGRSFDCTRHVKRSGSRSAIAPADPRHRSRPADRCVALVTSGRDLELVMGRAVCDWVGWKR